VDVAARRPEATATLAARAEALGVRDSRPPPPVSEFVLERLRALGYAAEVDEPPLSRTR
jgi:hypothetical protein